MSNQKVKDDMAWSSTLFVEQVWPIIKPFLDNGELMSMEGRPDIELAKQLDMKAGIDGWQIHKDGIRGIASRIQESKRLWDTFTIRLSRDSGAITEFEKRLKAIESPDRGWIYPALTVQAYAATKKGPILSCGITNTKDLIQYIKSGLHYTRRTSNASFAVCIWRKMIKNGYYVKIITAT